MGVRIVALVMVALCAALCVASVAGAQGAKTIADAPSIKPDTLMHGRLFDGAYISGYSIAYWNAPLLKGDRITIVTDASGSDTPPCQVLFMPGTDDINVQAQPPVLEAASATRDGTHDVQRFVATATGTYVLGMTNDDIFLSGPHQCLDAPSETPFTFTVTASHGGGEKHSEQSGGSGNGGGGSGINGRTHIVEPGQSLWLIAQGIVGRPASIAQVAFEVGRLWRLNAVRIGTGNPDLIYAGQQLRLK